MTSISHIEEAHPAIQKDLMTSAISFLSELSIKTKNYKLADKAIATQRVFSIKGSRYFDLADSKIDLVRSLVLLKKAFAEAI